MRKASILIVDDLAANRLVIEELLGNEDWQIHSAADGKTALEMAAELQPDLILLDVQMPGMDGFEVCTRLRAEPLLAEIPILLVTSLDDRTSRLRGIDAGADDFITKPFDRVELRVRVRGILRLNRYRRLQEERKQLDYAQERIRDQAALIDFSPSAIFVQDLDCLVTYWNPAAERLYGWQASEVLGQTIDQLIFKQGVSWPAQYREKLFADGQWRGEIRQIDRQRREIIVDSQCALLRDMRGDPKGVLIINSDITEKKNLEAQFLRSQRMECIGALASGIAHDLNNILAPSMMSIELIRLQVKGGDSIELLDLLETSTRRGASLINQILAFARGSGGEKNEVQMRHLVGEVRRMLHETLPAGITITTDHDSELWPVFGNASQIDQVLMNLCVNARDAMPNGGELSVLLNNAALAPTDCSGIPEARPGNYVCVSVSDTGAGMPPAVLSRIFDAFFTTKGEGKGTGLGLATVQAIVKNHHGFLTVQSEPGCGTCFKIYFPAITSASTEETSQADAGLPRGHGECVLVVDNEAPILQTTTLTLEQFGFRTLRASDGLEALKLFSANSDTIRMVITDGEMPNINGPTLAQILHRLDSKIPIIMTCGGQANANIKAEGHVSEYLKKPLAAPELLQTIHRLLAQAA